MVLGLVLSLFLSPVLAIAAIIAVIAVLFAQRRLVEILNAVPGSHYLMLFTTLTLGVSAIHANAMGILYAIAMSGLFMVALYVRSVMTPLLMEKIIDWSSTASIPGFLVILAQSILVKAGPEYRASSLFLNANYYATITVLVALTCVHRLLHQSEASRLRGLIILTMNLAGLYLSGCRTAILALFLSILAMLVLDRRYRTAAALIITGMLTTAVALRFPELMPRFNQSGSDLADRMAIWRTAVKGILANPWFGQGARTYLLTAAKFGGPVTWHAHSLYLDPILNFGFAGTSLFLLYVRDNLRSILRLRHEQREAALFPLISAMLISILVHGLMDITVFQIQTGLLVCIYFSSAGIADPRVNTLKRAGAGSSGQPVFGGIQPRPERPVTVLSQAPSASNAHRVVRNGDSPYNQGTSRSRHLLSGH